ncbi:MAG: regulatory protein RecX [Lachnospiraceae bacterium]|nr:regulatory protein RecX [Lachnospiraceae bacterium]
MDNSKARCSAFDKAVNLLAFKDRTVQEINIKLKEKGYSSEEVDEAVEKLSYYGYLNDQRYTISYFKDNASKKGKKLIVRELDQKGVDKNVIVDVLDDMNIDELHVVEDIIKRRYASIDLEDDKAYRRLVGYFLRRGFSYDNVRKALRNRSNCEDLEYFSQE